MNVRTPLLHRIFPFLAPAADHPEEVDDLPYELEYVEPSEDTRSFETYLFSSVWEGRDATILTVFRRSHGDSGVSVRHNDSTLHFDLEAWNHGFLIPSLRHFRNTTCRGVYRADGYQMIDEIIARFSSCKWDTASASDINDFIRQASSVMLGEDFWLARMVFMIRPLISVWVELRDNPNIATPLLKDMMDLEAYIRLSNDSDVPAPAREAMAKYLETLPGLDMEAGYMEKASINHGHVILLLNQLLAPSNGREGKKPYSSRYRQDDVCLGYRSSRPITAVSVVAEGGVYKIELTHPTEDFKSVEMEIRD